MAFQRPTLAEIVERVEQDFISRLLDGASILRRSVIRVFARAIAGSAHVLHGHLDYISKQLFIDTCDEENVLRWASIYDVARRPADYGIGVVTFTGSDGITVPSGTEIQNADGIIWTTDGAVTIDLNVATVSVTAREIGLDGNEDSAAELTLVSPIVGVDATCTVDSPGIQGGVDEEDIEDLRARVLDRIQNAPHGGNENDYIQWTLEISGITRVWVNPQELGANTVVVRFVLDDETDIIPNPTKVAEVQAYLDDLAPVTADVTVVAPVAVPINFTIAVTPNTTAVKEAVEAQLEDLIRRVAEPGATIYLSQINEAISLATGETDHSLTVPSANVTVSAGQISTIGTITWL